MSGLCLRDRGKSLVIQEGLREPLFEGGSGTYWVSLPGLLPLVKQMTADDGWLDEWMDGLIVTKPTIAVTKTNLKV